MKNCEVADVSFVIPSYNTLSYTMMAYHSVRKYYPKNEIIVLDDGSTDGTEEWLFGSSNENGLKIQGQEEVDENLRAWKNATGKIMGHTITYDIGIKMARNKLVAIFHSDMICGKNYLENLIKHWKPKTVVCATRIEPEGIYPPGKEKILKPFGIEFHEFKREEFDKFVEEEMVFSKNKTTNGIFAPWLISKEDFLSIGGHDAAHFAPYPEEDADLFLRFHLAGYKLIQSRDSLCWHWISRGHRSWAKNGVGKDDNTFQFYQNRARRNYLRKWHKWMQFDEWHHPISHPVYNIGFVLSGVTNDVHNIFVGNPSEFLHVVEPWATHVYVDNWDAAEKYIAKEQPTTRIDLRKRIFKYESIENNNNDLLLSFSESDYFSNNQHQPLLWNLTNIISEGVEDNSEMELGIFKLKTKNVKDVSSTLIKL